MGVGFHDPMYGVAHINSDVGGAEGEGVVGADLNGGGGGAGQIDRQCAEGGGEEGGKQFQVKCPRAGGMPARGSTAYHPPEAFSGEILSQ